MSNTKCGGLTGRKPSSGISIEEWRRALEAALSAPEAARGVTTAEISEILGWSTRRTRQYMRAAIAAGFARLAGRRPYVRIDGLGTSVPVYALTDLSKFKRAGKTAKQQRNTEV